MRRRTYTSKENSFTAICANCNQVVVSTEAAIDFMRRPSDIGMLFTLNRLGCCSLPTYIFATMPDGNTGNVRRGMDAARFMAHKGRPIICTLPQARALSALANAYRRGEHIE